MSYQKLYSYSQKKGFFNQHQNVLIAVSGGVDSMNLLHFLYLYREKFNIAIAIAHVNHKQRIQSDDEENYLKKWADDHQVPIYIDYFKGKFSEARARDFRYDFFKKIMFEQDYTALVTAHHADDQIETLLMKLIRGTRLKHFIGIQEVQTFGNGQLVRPLLNISKSELLDIFHFEDESNNSHQYFRNRVRNTYLPMLEKENPQFSHHLQILARENLYLQEVLSELTQDMTATDLLFFQSQSKALQHFLLQNYLENFDDLQLGKSQFEQILSLLKDKNSYHIYLKSGYFLKKTDFTFNISKIIPKTDSSMESKVLEYQGSLAYQGFQFHFKEGEQGIPLNSLSPIILRGRQAGDKIYLGTFSKKIRRLLIDEKIPLEERQHVIIGEQDDEIIFVQTRKNLYLRKSYESDTMKVVLLIEKIEEW